MRCAYPSDLEPLFMVMRLCTLGLERHTQDFPESNTGPGIQQLGHILLNVFRRWPLGYTCYMRQTPLIQCLFQQLMVIREPSIRSPKVDGVLNLSLGQQQGYCFRHFRASHSMQPYIKIVVLQNFQKICLSSTVYFRNINSTLHQLNFNSDMIVEKQGHLGLQ